jgi:hypothetical protein
MFRFYVALIVAAEVIVLALLPLIAPGVPVLFFAPVLPLTLAGALILRRFVNRPAYRMRHLSPEEILRHRAVNAAENRDPTPEELSYFIVERTAEIRRTLAESPSEVQIEMCALGYRACVNDMITLTHLANEELPNANFLRRFVLRRARKKATDALTQTREALPASALRATRQEQQ